MNIEEKKKEILDRLSELFVDRYDFFKETVDKLNELLARYDVDFQYDYNTFCKEYIDKCMTILEENPEIDVTDNKYFLVYGIISASIVSDKEKKYGKGEPEKNENNK